MDCSVLIVFPELEHEDCVLGSAVDCLLSAEFDDEGALLERGISQLKCTCLLLLLISSLSLNG